MRRAIQTFNRNVLHTSHTHPKTPMIIIQNAWLRQRFNIQLGAAFTKLKFGVSIKIIRIKLIAAATFCFPFFLWFLAYDPFSARWFLSLCFFDLFSLRHINAARANIFRIIIVCGLSMICWVLHTALGSSLSRSLAHSKRFIAFIDCFVLFWGVRSVFFG